MGRGRPIAEAVDAAQAGSWVTPAKSGSAKAAVSPSLVDSAASPDATQVSSTVDSTPVAARSSPGSWQPSPSVKQDAWKAPPAPAALGKQTSAQTSARSPAPQQASVASPPASSSSPAAAVSSSPEAKPNTRALAIAAIKQALAAMKHGSVELVRDAQALVMGLRGKPNDRVVNITLDNLVTALFFSGLLFSALLIKLFSPSWLHMTPALFFGMGLGCALVILYYLNRKEKDEINQVMAAKLGIKGLQHMLGQLPSWLSYTESEKMEWLNRLLEEVWPYVDKAVCKQIKAQVEQVFEDTIRTMNIPAVKRIGFKQLTFGDAPFNVESIAVEDDNTNGMSMTLGVRWCGDANITLAIELGDMAKLCPRVTDILFVGKLKVRLDPLIDKVPGFGAATITFMKVPQIKYRLDFGKAMGGSYAGALVRPVISNVVNNQLVQTLVWPQRMVVPLSSDPEVKPKIDRMCYRSVGVVRVEVLRAEGLRKTDLLGKSDPVAELTTDGSHMAETKCIKNTLTPEWNETFWLLVQEPLSQEMKVTVSDVDLFSAKEGLNAKELLGRCLVRLKPVCQASPEPVTASYFLGNGDWSNAEGCGKGSGKIFLKMLYRAFEDIKPEEPVAADNGILMVQLNKTSNLVRKDRRTGKTERMNVYCRVRLSKKDLWLSPPTMNKEGSTEHVWTFRNVHEFHNVKFDQDLRIKVMQKTAISGEDEVGVLDMAVQEVAEARDLNLLTGVHEAGFMQREFRLEECDNADNKLHVTLRYVPYF